MLNHVVICLGSNVPSCRVILDGAIAVLGTFFHDSPRMSLAYFNPSFNGIGQPYLNQVLEATTTLNIDSLHRLCRTLERRAGRTPQSKVQGIMPLDIDIVIWNGTIVRPFDYTSPHFAHGYANLHPHSASGQVGIQ